MKDVAVLINTWDGYSCTWPMMAHGLKKYWPDCPWPIYWMSNELDPPLGIPIKCGPDSDWAMMMRHALNSLEESAFLLLLEDYWLFSETRTDILIQYASYCVDPWLMDHIQLMPSWGGMKSAGPWRIDKSLHKVSDRSKYRTSNQASLWRTSQYLSLLFDGCTTWDFELLQPAYLRCLQVAQDAEWPIKYVYRQLPEWRTEPVVRGKFTIAAQKYIEREGIEIEFSHHPSGILFDEFKDHGVYIHESFEED